LISQYWKNMITVTLIVILRRWNVVDGDKIKPETFGRPGQPAGANVPEWYADADSFFREELFCWSFPGDYTVHRHRKKMNVAYDTISAGWCFSAESEVVYQVSNKKTEKRVEQCMYPAILTGKFIKVFILSWDTISHRHVPVTTVGVFYDDLITFAAELAIRDECLRTKIDSCNQRVWLWVGNKSTNVAIIISLQMLFFDCEICWIDVSLLSEKKFCLKWSKYYYISENDRSMKEEDF